MEKRSCHRWRRLEIIHAAGIMELSHQDRNAVLHSNLSQWIIQNGGTIHKSLSLCHPNDISGEHVVTSSSTNNKTPHPDSSQRGIFARHSSITKGEELIRLPSKLTLDGRDLPVTYGEQKKASAWLRCLASLLQAWHVWQNTKSHGNTNEDHSKDDSLLENYLPYKPYLDSLPETYDSLLNWSSWELRSFLAGTTLGLLALSGIQEVDANQRDADSEDEELEASMHARYQTTVVPYLKYLKKSGFFAVHDTNTNDYPNIRSTAKRQKTDVEAEKSIESLYKLFRQGCMCISTRAFHMQSTPSSSTEDYPGPYLLPYIDLLNHAPTFSPKHVTTLRRDPHDGSFVMVAERDIERGEEICHSYDSGGFDVIADVCGAAESANSKSGPNASAGSLTSAQSLQTFGFVDVKCALERLSCSFHKNKSLSTVNGSHPQAYLTPAILTKEEICQTCKDVSMSPYPHSLRQSMEETGLVDDGWEHWELPLRTAESMKSNAATSRLLDGLPNDVIIPYENLFSDELITLFSLNFLPNEAVDDLLCASPRSDHPIMNSLLLTEEVLDDYYLGKLVLHSIIQVVDEKLKRYQVSWHDERLEGRKNTNGSLDVFLEFMRGVYNESTVGKSLSWGKSEAEDLNVLSRLMSNDLPNSIDGVTQRDLVKKFMYGMTISLEERCCLLQLKKMALDKLLVLDES